MKPLLPIPQYVQKFPFLIICPLFLRHRLSVSPGIHFCPSLSPTTPRLASPRRSFPCEPPSRIVGVFEAWKRPLRSPPPSSVKVVASPPLPRRYSFLFTSAPPLRPTRTCSNSVVRVPHYVPPSSSLPLVSTWFPAIEPLPRRWTPGHQLACPSLTLKQFFVPVSLLPSSSLSSYRAPQPSRASGITLIPLLSLDVSRFFFPRFCSMCPPFLVVRMRLVWWV